jgi:hypothetical protein
MLNRILYYWYYEIPYGVFRKRDNRVVLEWVYFKPVRFAIWVLGMVLTLSILLWWK